MLNICFNKLKEHFISNIPSQYKTIIMMDINFTETDVMFKMLSEYILDSNENFPNHLKCTKCKNILNNAQQAYCGCGFCSRCLIELTSNGINCCPGTTDNCKISMLANTYIDYSIIRDISNLVVKCPLGCFYMNKMINMHDHLMVCSNNSTNSFVNTSGSDTENMLRNDNVVQKKNEFYDQIKMLVGTVENIKNENNILKQKIEEMNEEIQLMHVKLFP